MGTIVQEYGPFYGEAVNGTVFGRPNGSVYVPLSNTIEIYPKSGVIAQNGGTGYILMGAGCEYVAQAQDLASFVQLQVFDDSACTTPTATGANRAAGSFNGIAYSLGGTPDTPLVSGQKYYVRAQLINNGVPVATSSVKEVEAV